MDVIKFTDQFFAMEKELDLFSRRINEVQWWDLARHDVFNLIYNKLSGVTKAQPPKISFPRRTADWGWRKVAALVLQAKLKLFRYEVLALRTPRHLVSNGGRRVDIVLDDILACTPGRKLIINTFPHFYHIRLPKKSDSSLNSKDLCDLNAEIISRFSIEVDAEELINLILTQYKAAYSQYQNMLLKSSPKFVLLVGVEKALFGAARMLSIPVIEAQHGLINYCHPAYSYPEYISYDSVNTLPLIFLTFSPYWSEKCHYPVKKKLAIGNRQLFVEPKPKNTSNVLVISSAVHEEPIEKIMCPTASILRGHRFIYKLHPNQFARTLEIKKRLVDSPNVEIISNEQNLQQLSERCFAVFCINSTGVYEALQAGLKVFLLAKQDYQKHSDVFNHTSVHVVHSHDELVQVLIESRNEDTYSGNSTVFFQNFNKMAVSYLMSEMSK